MDTTTRNATLTDLVALLRDQQARKVDVVAPATTIRSVDGVLRITGTDPVLDESGVTPADGLYRPTVVCDEGIAEKLGVPVKYLRTLRETRPDLYDANVNGWLHGRKPLGRFRPNEYGNQIGAGTAADWIETRPGIPADPRAFLVRCFRGDDGEGVARAFLSDRYGVVDHLDVLTSALDGIRDAGADVDVDGGDLTDRRMVLRVTCPAVQALAPVLLRGYRSPFTGESGDENPTVWAGFQISNSETGGGAFTIVPRLVVQVCRNGMTITRDAVTTFLSADYLTATIAALEERAGETVETPEQVRTLVKAQRYTDADLDGILGHFIRGGQTTRAGVVNAITAYAQDVPDGDAAYDLEARATALLLT